MDTELVMVNPFTTNGLESIRDRWHGKLYSLDGTSLADFKRDDLDKVIYSYSTPTDNWDGVCASVCKLKDGRFIAWETSWGPTGNGFSEDAYGDIYVSSTLEDAFLKGISTEIRHKILESVRLKELVKELDEKTIEVSTGDYIIRDGFVFIRQALINELNVNIIAEREGLSITIVETMDKDMVDFGNGVESSLIYKVSCVRLW